MAFEDSVLFLKSVEITDSQTTKCFNYEWNVTRIGNIKKDVLHRSHYIYIRNKLHRLCYGRAEISTYTDEKIDRFYVNLFPTVKNDIKVEFLYGSKFYESKFSEDTFRNKSMYCVDESSLDDHSLKFRIKVPNKDDIDVILPINEFENYLDFARRMTKLYLDDQFVDLKIVVDDKEFEVHRAVLVSSSTAFAEMVAQNSTERKDTIYIKDCNSKAFETFLKYIYLGKLDRLDEKLAFDVFKLADKYELQQLKSETSRILSGYLNIDNVIEYYKLAVMSRDSNLKMKSLKFMAGHTNEITKLPEWPTLRSSEIFVDSLLVILAKRKQ